MASKIAATATAAGRTSAINFGRNFSGGLNASGLWQDAAGKWRNSLGQFATAAEQQAAGVGQRVGATMAQNVNAGASKFWKTAGFMAIGATVAGGAALAGVTALGLKTAAANEQAAISFKVLMGSAEAAEAQLQALADFAAKTPFDLPTLRDAAARLQAVGLEADRVIPLMTAVGDSTAAMGTGAEGISRAVYALQDIQTAGRAYTMDIRQLKNAGIDAWGAIAAQMNVTAAEAQKMASEGKISAETVFKAIESYSGEGMQRVKGMMDEQATTLTGQLSTLKDTLEQTLGKAAQPLADSLKSIMPEITGLAQGLATALAPTFDSLGQIATALIPILEPVGAVLANLANNLLGILAPTLEALAPAFAALAPAINQFVDMLGGALAAILPDVATLLSELVVALMPLASAFMTLLGPMLEVLPTLFGAVVQAITPVIEVFAQVAMILGGAMKRHMNEIVPLLGQLASAFGQAFIDMAPTFKEIALAMVPVAQEFAKLLPEFTKLAVEIIPLLIPVIRVLGQVFARIGANQIIVLVQGVMLLMRVGMALIQAWIAVVSFFKGVPGQLSAVWSTITGAVSGMVSAVSGFFSGLVSAISGFIGSAVSVVSGLPGQVLGALGNLGSLLYESGKALIQGFINGIKDMAGSVGDAVGGVLDGARRFFPFSPAKEGPFSGRGYTTYSGEALMRDFAAGINRGGKSAMLAARGVMGTVRTGMDASAPSMAWKAPRSAVQGLTGGGVTYEVTVNNPVPEKASQSLPAAMRRTAFVQGYGM